MKIGLFTDTYTPEINGVVSSVLMLREGLEKLGHEVWVFAPGHPEISNDDERVIRIPSLPLVVLPERRVASPLDIGMMSKIRELDLDVIHTHTEFGVGSFGFRAAHRYKIPHVHTYHTVWEEYTHYVALKLFDEPAKLTVRRFTRFVCEHCDRIIAPTQKTKDLLESYKIAVPIDVAPTGVDLARFSAPTEADGQRLHGLKLTLGIQDFEHVILSIGRVAPEKSIVELFELVAPHLQKHPEDCLLIVGGGPSRKDLEKLRDEYNLADQVIFTGEIPWSSVPDYYRISDVLIGNSHTETQGLTFIEALASGVPIVVRYNECFDGIIEDGVSGTLFTDEGVFEEELAKVLTDDAFRTNRVQNGLAAAQAVSKENFVRNIEGVYHRAIVQD